MARPPLGSVDVKANCVRVDAEHPYGADGFAAVRTASGYFQAIQGGGLPVGWNLRVCVRQVVNGLRRRDVGLTKRAAAQALRHFVRTQLARDHSRDLSAGLAVAVAAAASRAPARFTRLRRLSAEGSRRLRNKREPGLPGNRGRPSKERRAVRSCPRRDAHAVLAPRVEL